MSIDNFNHIKGVLTALNSLRPARFSYRQDVLDAAPEDEVAYLTGVYELEDTSQVNSIPAPEQTALSDVITAVGLRTQAATISRMAINHFFGRLSLNLIKLTEKVKLLAENHLVNRYITPTGKVMEDLTVSYNNTTVILGKHKSPLAANAPETAQTTVNINAAVSNGNAGAMTGADKLSLDNLNSGADAAVRITGAQTVAGVKTFTSIPVGPASNPTTDNQLARKAYVDSKVSLTGNETVAGIKTFSSIPVGPASNPTTDNQLARKAYVDTQLSTAVKLTGNETVAGVKTFTSIPVGPASNPTTDNQLARKAYVDTQLSTAVKLTGAQTVAGIKTFSSIPVGPASNPTTDNQLARKKYVDDNVALKVGLSGAQTVAGVKTFSSNPISSAAQSAASNALTRKDYVDGAYDKISQFKRGSNYHNRKDFNKVKSASARTTLVIPDYIETIIDGDVYNNLVSYEININTTTYWDNTLATNWSTASKRAGKDFYIYACVPTSGETFDIVLSANSTYPTGYTASNSRKIGGFHCLCVSAGTAVYGYINEGKDADYLENMFADGSTIANGNTNHWLKNFIQGDILPLSCWDLIHRPNENADVEGKVYDPKTNLWVDIYLPSWNSGLNKLLSVYGGTIADGTSYPAFHWYRFSQVFTNQGQRLPRQDHFVACSLGSPQRVNIAGGVDPGTTGGKTATNSLRIISNIGVEDATGVLWQWGSESGTNTGTISSDAYNANDKNVGGQEYSKVTRPFFGGSWVNGVECGSRGSVWNGVGLYLNSNISGRGFAEPK